MPENRPSEIFALVESTVDDLIRSGWHPDRIIEAARLMLRDHPEYPEAAIGDLVWGNYEAAKDRGLKKAGRAISNELKRYIKGYSGEIFLNEVYDELQITNPQDRAAAQTFFSRQSSNGGPLQKVGRGHFRIKISECNDIDIFADVGTSIDFKWPLGLHEYFITMPKNIIIVAGEADAGKTAFLLNCARKNMEFLPVDYFSSEMGALELKTRLSKFRAPMEVWRKVRWKERNQDFCDVIEPDHVNIIDFLEIHDEFYKIGGMIKDIHDKLTNGIAIIAIQKNEGTDRSLGGFRSVEKARLYITMERIGRTKIVKCKNWRDETINPNGLCKRWKLGGGCHFKEESGWVREDDETASSVARSSQFQPRR